MPLEADLLALMQDTVIIEPATGQNANAEFTYGASVSVKCYIARGNKKAIDRTGREVVTSAQVILATPDLKVSVNDRITMPDGRKPAIIQVLAANDDVGPYYEEIDV